MSSKPTYSNGGSTVRTYKYGANKKGNYHHKSWFPAKARRLIVVTMPVFSADNVISCPDVILS